MNQIPDTMFLPLFKAKFATQSVLPRVGIGSFECATNSINTSNK